MWDEKESLNLRTTWERQNEYGDYERCNENSEGAYEVKTCLYCGRRIRGYTCSCAESKW